MPPTTKASPRVIFSVLAAATASISLLQSLVTPVLPTIQSDLHTSASTVTWVITAWLLTASVATPLLGRVGDMAGKERTLLVALGAIALGSALAAAAPTISVLIAGRVLQGVGAAVFPLTFAVIRDEFPPERVPSAVGAIAAVIATGGGAGVVLAGPVVNLLSWRWLFWIPAIASTVIWFLVLRFVPESPVRTPGKLNLRAALLLSGWLVALLVPVTKGHAWGWGSRPVVGLLLLAVVLFAGWMRMELRSSNPLIDMRMMRLPAVWTTNLVALLFGAAMFTTYAFLPIFMQTPTAAGYGFGSSVTGAGLLLLPMLVGMAVVGFVSGSFTAVVSSKAQLVAGATLLMLSCGWLVFMHDTRWQVSLAAGVSGIGMGLAFSSMVNLVVNGVPPEQTGVASGMNTNLRTIGGSIGTAVVSSLISARLLPTGVPVEAGFTHAFTLMTLLAAVAVGAALLVPARARRQAQPVPSPLLDERSPALDESPDLEPAAVAAS
jgi:EmrB/QacA subfamily drug resistance transporter